MISFVLPRKNGLNRVYIVTSSMIRPGFKQLNCNQLQIPSGDYGDATGEPRPRFQRYHHHEVPEALWRPPWRWICGAKTTGDHKLTQTINRGKQKTGTKQTVKVRLRPCPFYGIWSRSQRKCYSKGNCAACWLSTWPVLPLPGSTRRLVRTTAVHNAGPREWCRRRRGPSTQGNLNRFAVGQTLHWSPIFAKTRCIVLGVWWFLLEFYFNFLYSIYLCCFQMNTIWWCCWKLTPFLPRLTRYKQPHVVAMSPVVAEACPLTLKTKL